MKRLLLQNGLPTKLTDDTHIKQVSQSQVKNRPKLSFYDFPTKNDPNLYEYLELDSDSDISGLDKEQVKRVNSYLKSQSKFFQPKVEHKKIKGDGEEDQGAKYMLEQKRFGKVHGFFSNVYKKSKDKSMKFKKLDFTAVKSEKLNGLSVDCIKDDRVQSVKLKLPKMKFFK
jgi:hypothetical protein